MDIFRILLLGVIFQLMSFVAIAQPEPCGENAAMSSFCIDACAVCDIDGFTGINDLNDPGQAFDGFCTIGFNNIQYIAFIAGTEDLTIRVDVGNCNGGSSNLEVGFFESLDCNTFTPITDCDTNIPQNTSQTFETFVPLVVGQHYYLVIDGSMSANCEWTFNVLEGSTAVLPLDDSGIITVPEETCPGVAVPFSTTGEVGAAIYEWTVDGVSEGGNSKDFEFSFPADGTYNICVTASNVCDEAPPTCTTYQVSTPESFSINEQVCEGDCIEVNGVQFCETGTYQEVVTLPNGCDSLININLEVLPPVEVFLDVWLCTGDEFFIGTTAYDMTGSYESTILTANNCDSIVSLDLLLIECEISGETEEIPVICNGTTTGTLIFSVDQGEPPLIYTYTNVEDGTITGTGTTNLLTNNEIPNIAEGLYQIYISDDFGNDVVFLQEVTEPDVLEINLEPSDYGGFNVSCFLFEGVEGDDGTLTANVTGGVIPYSYLWSDGQTSQTATGLTYENYSVTITDNVGCSTEANYTLLAPPLLMADAEFTDPNCDGLETGEIEILLVNGGVPDYTYSLDNENYQSSPLFTGLSEGTYDVYVMDNNACIELISSELTAPEIPEVFFPDDELTLDLGDSLMLSPIVNDIEIGNISWSDSLSLSCSDCLEPYASPVNTTEYFLTVTSMDDCVDIDSILITLNKNRPVFIPNAFTPNFDGVNDELVIFAGKEVEQVRSLQVFSRWGELVFERNNFAPNTLNLGWDGTHQGKELDSDVFTYVAIVDFIDGVDVLYKGDVTIVR